MSDEYSTNFSYNLNSFLVFETKSCYAVQADLELTIPLPQPPAPRLQVSITNILLATCPYPLHTHTDNQTNALTFN